MRINKKKAASCKKHEAAFAFRKSIILRQFFLPQTTEIGGAILETATGMPVGMKSIPRASVAHFLVKALEQPEIYSRTSVGLALGKD